MVLWRNAKRAGLGVLALSILVLLPAGAQAQRAKAAKLAVKAAPSQLSLSDALQLARGQNPDYLVTQNDEADAGWAVRQAYGALLPTAQVGMGFEYQASGNPQVVGGLTSSDFGISSTPPYYTSSWGLNFGYSLSGAALYAPSLLKARRRAAVAQTDASGAQLDAGVTQQYIGVLQAQDALKLANEQLASATENLRLAQAKVDVGSAIGLEAKQAEVERGHAQVTVLKAQNDLAAQKLQLGQKIGTELPADVTLTTTFDVFTPPWSESELMQRALQRQPALRAAAAQEDAAQAQIKSARTAYLPTLDFAVGFSGYARENGNKDLLLKQAQASSQGQIDQCQLYNDIATGLTKPLPTQDCSLLVLTPAARQKLLDGNNAFPFRYTSQPWYAQMRISLPVFSGLNRERNLEGAKLAAETARLRTHSQELATRTAVSTAYATLVTAQKAFDIEKVNREAAAEQLTLEQERYRVGSSSFIQLQDAQTRKAQADNTYILALYGFQNALATLESAVGEKLTTPKTGN